MHVKGVGQGGIQQEKAKRICPTSSSSTKLPWLTTTAFTCTAEHGRE